jgi:hypothetical protein
MATVVGVDRSYVKQGKDPETALRLSDRPNLEWIRLLVEGYGAIATGQKRQISVRGDRLLVHAKADEVAEHLLPVVLAAVDRANERYATIVDAGSEREAVPLEGDEGGAIASAFDALDAAIVSPRARATSDRRRER